jgi:hypothetical protein
LYYVVGVSEQMIVFAEPPRWEWPDAAVRGRSAPRSRPRLAKDAPQPVTLAALAARTPLRRVTWRNGTKGPLSARFAWLRVWPAFGWAAGECAGAQPHWLLIERRNDGTLRYGLEQPAGHHLALSGRALLAQPLARRAGLSANEGRVRVGPF